MKQREIWIASLDPTEGSEQNGTRPVVILSGNMMNELLQVVIVCPLTSNVKGYKGNIILQPDNVNNLTSPSETLIFHIRSVSKFRLVRKVGKITQDQLTQLKNSLDDILRY
ncbi:type II toxin-antitoxin system PemK/MazF family toxin [Marinoscillum sp. MHG1-6]|uniref:type II toxin-antitoxin system PemK/MazF family toxin n=1 Tax=Marinoscillum sp. MHG1-6 TaxID=2959627 RepID=UPI0021582E36|nr:type II toxin-antitoxin system PemK/MazF family toxin [Marinoscillum sp. MHG1-6]